MYKYSYCIAIATIKEFFKFMQTPFAYAIITTMCYMSCALSCQRGNIVTYIADRCPCTCGMHSIL